VFIFDVYFFISYAVIEFLFLFVQIINYNVKPVIHYVLNRRQQWTTVTANDFQLIFCRRQSWTAADSPQLSPI